MGAREIKRYRSIKNDAGRLVETAINKLGLSTRAYSRVLKVGRTIADLAGAENIEASHIAEAIQYGAWIGGCRFNSGSLDLWRKSLRQRRDDIFL